MKHTDPPIIVEALLPAPKEKVWRAITELYQMHQWFFDNIPAFEARVGFEVTFDVVAPSRVFPHVWKIIKVEDGKQITYDWSSGDAYSGRGHVIFDLNEAEEGQTRITLTNIIVEDYPDDIPEFKRESCEGGWNYFIKDRLASYITSLNS